MKTIIKSPLILTLFFFIGSLQVNAQDLLPFLNDNHSGVTQMTLQPASIAGSPLKLDINVIGGHNGIRNDMVKFETKGIWRFNELFNDPDWWNRYTLTDAPDGKAKNALINNQILGPAFMLSIDAKQSAGFSYRMRSMINVDNVHEPLARSIYNEYEESQYWNQWLRGTQMWGTQHVWAEYDFFYAREIYDGGDHYVKGGATLKFLQGLGSVFFYTDQLDYYFQKKAPASGQYGMDADSVSWNSPLIEYGVSENWGFDRDGDVIYDPAYNFVGSPTVGLDIGFVYEWRPDHEKFVYDMDGKKGLVRLDQNRYKLKVGVSVLDIGSIKYEKSYNSTDFAANFTPGYPNVTPNNTNTNWMNLDEVTMGFPPYMYFTDTINNRVEGGSVIPSSSNSNEFKVRLPTAISLQLDYCIDQNFYINFTAYNALNQGTSVHAKNHYLSTYSITPRYEGKWFGASLPVSYNQFNQFEVGIGLRLGFIYVGTNDLLGLAGIVDEPYGANVQFAVKIPIFRKAPPSDIDGDAVSDSRDKCPTVPGVLDFDGCPDKDGDGVPDNQDLCPDDPGLVEFDGCPDRDADGVIDKLDDCPSEPGLEEFNGCPDTDRDGIIDRDDRCPNTPGIRAFFGCPDTDEDGIPDNEDLCPTEPGLRENQGCPKNDIDGDGIVDAEDACPEQPGPVENRGCPYIDTDNDGVLDKDDNCPLTPGDPNNNGCPVIQEPDLEIINAAFRNLEFETNRAVILAGSYASLNELAKLLERKQDWKLKISGHTDSSGNDEYNMQLSEKRAKAVAGYFEGQGVTRDRLIVEWYGETRPIADNSTASGRAQNRRVEMEIVFD
jgi:outer membrane protein OmpA-like peptidoglycan-associated protein